MNLEVDMSTVEEVTSDKEEVVTTKDLTVVVNVSSPRILMLILKLAKTQKTLTRS